MTHRKCIIHVIPRLTLLIAFLLGVTGNTLVAAESPENIERNVRMPAQGGSELSTPELIEQAFVRGEITAEQRILYLAYALYDYKSLPSQYSSNVGWFGTSYAKEIDEAWKAGSLDRAQPISPAPPVRAGV